MKLLRFLFLFLTLPSFVNSQAIVRGKVSDESGETLIGVVILLKQNKTQGVFTDLDGNFSLKVIEESAQTIVISYIGYKSIEFNIKPLKKGEVLVKDFTLLSQNELAGVDIVAKQVKANEYYMENVKKNSATTLDYISSETMKKTGDPNVVAAVARVSGVSTSGGLITVRGIGDRYVKTTLNGSRIPTLDPLTNNIKLDLFPASLVDNVIITKTASPDLPGDWSGAYLSIETKDYPEKPMVAIESQFGYNPQTTFKDYTTSERSSTDWLGYDNGLRNRNNKPIQQVNFTTTQYQEMIALGLGNYYNSLGVTKNWQANSPEGETYFKLGLIQLGLLSPGQINDPLAYQNATAKYNATYKPEAFSKIYPEGSDFNHGFANNWTLKKRRAPINFTQNFAIGNQTTLFKKPFGYLLGFRYGSSVRFDPNGVSKRVGGIDLEYRPEIDDKVIMTRETNSWSALVNLAYKLNSKNSVSFLFMPNYMGTNDVASYSTRPNDEPDQQGRVANNIFYEQRRQLIYQFKSEHFISGPNIKIDFNTSYTKGNSIAPDFKLIEYLYVRDNAKDSITQYSFGTSVGEGAKRFYRYLSDNILDSRISAEFPFGKNPDAGAKKIKFGGAYQQNNRNQYLHDYALAAGNSTSTAPALTNDDINSILTPENFVMTNQQVQYIYEATSPARNFTFGKSIVKSGFLMGDFSLFKFFRVAGGLRIEQANIFCDVVDYYKKGYQPNDIRRENAAGFPRPNPAEINSLNLLPSLNLIFKLKENKLGQFNFRLNYSKTLARPSMRELNDAAIYDNEFRTLIYGNSSLKPVQVKNYDFRFESYFKKDNNLSISLFYKDFTDHIEMSFGSSGLTWNNVGKSTVRGIELEGKKSLTNRLLLRANVTFVQSNSQVIRKTLDIVDGLKVDIPTDTLNRPMFGQAPYIVNAMLVYTADSIGLTATIGYNVQGPRLIIAGIIPGRPDVYEMPRHVIDFKVSKTLTKHFSISVTIRDMLNAPVSRSYKLDNAQKYTEYDKFRFGTNYLFTLSYKL